MLDAKYISSSILGIMGKRRKIYGITILIVAVVAPRIINLVYGDFNIQFYAFYEYYCPGCAIELEPLFKTKYVEYSRDKLQILDIREGDNQKRYTRIINLVGEYLDLPLVGVFKNSSLVAIVSGLFMEDEWEKIVETSYEGVAVYAKRNIEPIKVIKDKKIIDELSKCFVEASVERIKIHQINIDVPSFLLIILTAAVLDSINPCEFYVLTILLSLVFLFSKERRHLLRAGLMFSLGVFMAYFLMGFGLIKLITYSTTARYVVALLGLTIGLRALINLAFGAFGISIGLREVLGKLFGIKFKRVPASFSKALSNYLRKAALNPFLAFATGVLSASLLSPCTSGPYFIALSLIADMENAGLGLLLLTIYNIIFILPLVVITLGVYTLRLKTKSLKQWSSKERKLLDLMMGLLMVVLGIYLIFYHTPFGSMVT